MKNKETEYNTGERDKKALLKMKLKIKEHNYDINAIFERAKKQAYKALKEKYKIN